MILPFDIHRSAESVARADLERRLRADMSMSALLDILDATDNRPKGRPRHAPARHDELALAVGARADDRSHLVRENTGQDRQVARAVMSRAKPVADRCLALGQ